MSVVLWIVLLIALNGYPSIVYSQQSYSTDLETQLRTYLFTDYEVLQRPSEMVSVTISLSLLYINDLDIKTQTFSTSGYFTMQWTDTRLNWATNMTYQNVRFLFSTEKYMWRPAIVVQNSNEDLEIFSDEDAMIRILSSGMSVWNPGGLFKTHCEADTTFYPLDTQECSIILTTWAYTANEINLALDADPVNLDSFQENGEWVVDAVTTTSEGAAVRGGDNSNSYSTLTFTFKLRRRPLFHILNTLFPVVLLASLVCCVFKLPPESGERVGMSLTVLLAYAVYLTLISDNIPKTSLHTSILSVYLTIILMLSALSVLFTIFVLDIYFNHEDDEDIPVWVQKVTRHVLIRISCWKGTNCCKNQVGVTDYTDNKKKNVLNLESLSTNKDVLQQQEKAGIDMDEEEANDEEIKLSWKEIALIFDKCLMYTFIGMVTICTITCVSLLASHS